MGLVTGLLNAVLIMRFVAQLQPDTRFAQLQVLHSALTRLGLTAIVLAFSTRLGGPTGLSAFTGLWLARWLFVAWLQCYRK